MMRKQNESLYHGWSSQGETNELSKTLMGIYRLLLKHFGPRHWWPGESAFEVMVGAILTQNTSWANVEKAIKNLNSEKLLNPRKLAAVRLKKLEKLVRPSGYYRQKATRLKIFLDFFLSPPIKGSIRNMKKIETSRLRGMLLSVKGIGPETADSILLYALDKPVFVVDAYTSRIFSRLGLVDGKISYEDLRGFFTKNLARDVPLFKDYHAQLVALGKEYCRKQLRCSLCPLLGISECKNK